MANKVDEKELNKSQNPAEGENKEEAAGTKSEGESKKEEKNVKERKPWSTRKKIGVGAGVLATVFGVGVWIKKKFFDNDDGDEEDE